MLVQSHPSKAHIAREELRSSIRTSVRAPVSRLAVIAAPSFRVCTADQIQRTRLRPAYRRSEESAGSAGVVTLIGWLAGGIGIGALSLFGLLSVRAPEAGSASGAADVAGQLRGVTVIEVGPPVTERAEAPPTDFEIPDDTPARAAANVAKQAKRRPVLERRSPY